MLGAKKSRKSKWLNLEGPRDKLTEKKENGNLSQDSDNEDPLNQESLLEEINREEVNKEFRKHIKKYYLFEVKKTPCIQDLAEYITFNTDLLHEDQSSLADKDKNDLIYYNNKKRFEEAVARTSLVLWILCLLTDLAYYFIFSDVKQMKFQLSDCHLMLACLNFFIPAIIKVAEAWSNSVIHSLFDILRVSDYNKKFNSQINQTINESALKGQNQKPSRKFGRKGQKKDKEENPKVCERLTKCFRRDTKMQESSE